MQKRKEEERNANRWNAHILVFLRNLIDSDIEKTEHKKINHYFAPATVTANQIEKQI